MSVPVEQQLAELRAAQRTMRGLLGGFVCAVLALLIVGAPIAMAGGMDTGGMKSSGGVAGQDVSVSSVTTTAAGAGLTMNGAGSRVTFDTAQYLTSHSATGRLFSTGGYSGPGFALGSAVGATNLTDSATAATVVACSGTAASVTMSNGTASIVFDVGTSCAGESTAVFTLPAATNGWICACSSTTADRMIQQKVLPPASTTQVTMQNIVVSTGANGDFTDGADVGCLCKGI